LPELVETWSNRPVFRARLPLLFALGLTGLVRAAPAQEKNAAPSKFAVPGSRDSVSVGNRDVSPTRRRAPAGRARADAAVATFPGFRLLPDGKSRIYVELTKAVVVDERRAAGLLVYVIHDARVPVRNNRNALITTHFPTPVGRARLLSAGRDIELLIDLRQAASATHRVVAGENGGARLEVDFPAGDYAPAPGLFEPPTAKGRTREAEESQPSDQVPAQSGAKPAASSDPARAPADASRAAPSGTATTPPPE
jgi:hypothetical protein